MATEYKYKYKYICYSVMFCSDCYFLRNLNVLLNYRKRKNLENCKEKPNSQFENECKIDNSGTILPLDSAYQPLEMEDVRNQGYQATIFKSSHPDNYNDYALPEAVVHTNKANKPGDPKLSRNQYANIHGEASQKTAPSDGYITMDEAMGRSTCVYYISIHAVFRFGMLHNSACSLC